MTQRVLRLGAELGNDIEDGTVEHGPSCFDQGVSDPLREMTFANPGRADHQDVASLVDEGDGGEVVDELAIDL